MKRAMVQLEAVAPTSERAMTNGLRSALLVAEGLRNLPFEVNLWQTQNIWNDLFRRSDKNYWPPEWKSAFKKLGHALHIAVEDITLDTPPNPTPIAPIRPSSHG
jgi:hypothetical protein